MFFVGNARIGAWNLWVTTKNPHVRSFDLNEEYYDCLITKEIYGIPYYVNPSACELFPYFEMRHPPKEVKEDKETAEQKMYRIHWSAYVSRKDMSQPMWLLHRSVIEQMIDFLYKVETGVSVY